MSLEFQHKEIIDRLVLDIRTLSIDKGDTILVRVAPLKVFERDVKNKGRVLIDALLEAVGPDGTICGLSFSNCFFRPHKHPENCYDNDSKIITGGFAKALFSYEGSIRSRHPTNSWVAVGKKAQEMMDGHDHTKTAFYPIKALMENKGKMILIGCNNTSPGFSTVHYTQDMLGLSYKNVLSGKIGTYYKNINGESVIYKRKDISGCSNGFWKMYSRYIRKEKLTIGFIGGAYSLAIDAIDAFNEDMAVLIKNPKDILCDNQYCFHCRGSLFYNITDMPKYYFYSLPIRIFNKIRKQG